jgi:hypothetical protein
MNKPTTKNQKSFLDFENKSFITTNNDIKNLLGSCMSCLATTNNGENVLTKDFLLKNTKYKIHRNKTCFVINTLNSWDTQETGHWVTLCIDWRTNSAVIANSLRIIPKDTIKTINDWCAIHNLNITLLNFGSQAINSLNCGFHSKYFVHTFHLHGLNALFVIKKIFSKFAPSTIERFLKRKLLLS